MAQQFLPPTRIPLQKRAGFLYSSTLLLSAFASAFFPRLLEAVGAPSPVNFLHFILIPVTCTIVLVTAKTKNKSQLATVQAIIFGLASLVTISMASALLNNVSPVNVFLNLMLLTEPFIAIAAILSVPFTLKSLSHFRKWVLGFGATHMTLAFGQKLGLMTGLLKHTTMTLEDNIQGVFYLSSGGHVVAASVSLCFALYYYVSAKTVALWIRGAVVVAMLIQVLISDAKQVFAVGLVAWGLLAISRTKNISVTLQYVVAGTLVCYSLYWLTYNVDAFSAYQAWARPEIYGPNGDATVLKSTPLKLIPQYFSSPLNWVLGLGPGQTVGRIGGWMIRDYASMLSPLGATPASPVVDEIWQTWGDSYLDSSFFSPFWGWAGIWGDLGFLGLGSYLMSWWIVWTRVCKDDMSRFLVLNVTVNGLVFTLMEEPGFIITSVFLVCLRWHELRLKPSPQTR